MGSDLYLAIPFATITRDTYHRGVDHGGILAEDAWCRLRYPPQIQIALVEE